MSEAAGMEAYHRPASLGAALAALAADAAHPPADPSDRLAIVAGATDHYPAAASRRAWFQTTRRNILDITAIRELAGMSEDEDGFRFGALTTWDQIAGARLPPAFDGLRSAARQIGGAQIQNRATLAGNICNASPAADGAPALLALDAEVEMTAESGERRLPLASFLLGNRRTALKPGELVAAIRVPPPAAGERSVFLKLGARAYLVISIVSVSAHIACDERGRIASARVAIGACSETPVRLSALEARLCGEHPDRASRAVEAGLFGALTPIDDVRASAAYRLEAAQVLVRRALDTLGAPREVAA